MRRYSREVGLLSAIVALGLVLRIWGIRFGLPYDYHYDEHFYLSTALKLGRGILHNSPYPPVGFANVLAVGYGGYYGAMRILGAISSPGAMEALYRADPTTFFMIGRAVSAILGTLTILAVHAIGRAGGRRATAIAAAAFMAVAFIHVRESHYSVPDAPVTFLVTVATALAVTGLSRRRWSLVAIGAVAAGLAVAAKWTSLPVLMAPMWASYAISRRSHGALKSLLNGRTALVPVLALMGFSLASPQLLMNPAPYYSHAVAQYASDAAGGFGEWQVDRLPGWLFYLKTLAWGVGPVLLVLAGVGLLARMVAVRRSGFNRDIAILAFPMTYFLFMGSTRHYFARYAVLLVPFVALLAAEGAVLLSSWLGRRGSTWERGVLAALVLVAMAQPLASSLRHDLLLTREDTRTMAKDWIEMAVPPGARIAVDWPVHGPPLSTADTTVPYSRAVYDAVVVGGTGLSDHGADWYRQQGFDYVIASSFIYRIPLVYEARDIERQRFYRSLDEEFELVREFSPAYGEGELPFVFDEIYGPAVSLWQRERPGPVLSIYAVR